MFEKLFISLLVLIPVILCVLPLRADTEPVTHDLQKYIPLFDKVDENLYRGSQPSEEGFRALKEKGIVRVINFRNEKALIEKEKALVESLGMEYISIPWTIYGKYDPAIFDAFFSIIKDKDEKPTFFHCKRGSERTGVISAAYEMKYLHHSYEDALRKARNYDIKAVWYLSVKSKIEQFWKDLRTSCT